MLSYEELKEAIDKGFITNDTVNIVRKDDKIFDYVLAGETVRPHEVVTVKRVSDVLKEIAEY